MQNPRKLWWTRQELRSEIIGLLNRSNHSCSLWVIEQALNIPQPSIVTQIRLERCLQGLVRNGIVERVTCHHVDGRPFYLYRLAASIAGNNSEYAPREGELS